MRTEHVRVTSKSAEGTIKELGERAAERGYADSAYVEAVLEREAEYPTGLSVPDTDFGIAIPHADPEHVNREAVILGFPESSVAFGSMDDPGRTVDAEAVLLLLAAGSDEYTAFLSSLASLLQDDSFTAAIRGADPDAALTLVDEHCL